MIFIENVNGDVYFRFVFICKYLRSNRNAHPITPWRNIQIISCVCMCVLIMWYKILKYDISSMIRGKNFTQNKYIQSIIYYAEWELPGFVFMKGQFPPLLIGLFNMFDLFIVIALPFLLSADNFRYYFAICLFVYYILYIYKNKY